MSAEKPRAYRGEEKFIFVSYAHKDSAEVLGAIRALNARGCRVWYDEGIEAGEDWANTLGKALEKASLVLYFASRQSVKSENVLRELTYAREHGIPILTAVLGMISWQRRAALAAVTPAPTEAPFSPGSEYFGGAAPESLTRLDLSGRGLTDIGFLGEAVNLEELNLSGNAISDITPLASLTKLRVLDLRDNRVADVNVLLALPALEKADLRGNPVEDRTALEFMEGVGILG